MKKGGTQSGYPPACELRIALEVDVVDVVRGLAAGVVATHRAGQVDGGREDARVGRDRPHIDGRVGVDVAARQAGPGDRRTSRGAGGGTDRAGRCEVSLE